MPQCVFARYWINFLGYSIYTVEYSEGNKSQMPCFVSSKKTHLSKNSEILAYNGPEIILSEGEHLRKLAVVWGCSSVTGCLPIILEALGSIHGISKTKNIHIYTPRRL
jgi:hypothetical protein